jgi:hypothetical protein
MANSGSNAIMAKKTLHVTDAYFPWIEECTWRYEKVKLVEDVDLICDQVKYEFNRWTEFQHVVSEFFFDDRSQVNPGQRLKPQRLEDTFFTLLHETKGAGYRLLLQCVYAARPGIGTVRQLERWCDCLYVAMSYLERARRHWKIRRKNEELCEFGLTEEMEWCCRNVGRQPEDRKTLADWHGRLSALKVRRVANATLPWGEEEFTRLVKRTWHYMRSIPPQPGISRNWPREPKTIPDAFAAREAIDSVVRWCAEQLPTESQTDARSGRTRTGQDSAPNKTTCVESAFEERDRFMYRLAVQKQRLKWATILRRAKDKFSSAPTSIQGVRKAVNKYAVRHGCPLPARRRDKSVHS